MSPPSALVRGSIFFKKTGSPPSRGRRSRLVLDDLAVVDAHDVNARRVLRALLAGGALLEEGDVTVDALDVNLPERVGDRLRLGLAGELDRFDDGVDRIPAAEAFGEAAGVVL